MADSAANLAMNTRTSTQVHFPTQRAAFNNLTQDLDNDIMHWLMRSSEDPSPTQTPLFPGIKAAFAASILSSLSTMTTPAPAKHDMKYRYLGNSGLLVSTLSFGCMTFTDKTSVGEAYDILVKAYEGGVNYFDNAEGYTAGVAETLMGQAFKRGIEDGVWSREDLVVSTKIFLGTKTGPNDQGLGRKHIIEGTKASLKRAQLDYFDVVFCHRPEKATPIEETVRAMNYLIQKGWAFYWGTSEWSSHDIIEACEIADRLGLIRPIVEQPQYHIFERSRVEFEYVNLYKKYKFGLTTWSPLAFGILTGKYSKGIPEGARLEIAWAAAVMPDINARVAKTDKLKIIADELGCSLAQLAIA
ncbi:K+ channel protein, partial [Globisporangium splendens]